MNTRVIAAAAIVFLAGCGGGGGGGSAPVSTPVAPATTTPVSPSDSTKIVLSFPIHVKPTSSSTKRPAYVPGSATKIVVTVNTVNGAAPAGYIPTPQTTPLDSSTGGNCTLTGGVETCTISIPAPPGSVNYTFQVEDGSSNVLATLTQTFTIAQGTANSLTATLLGVVASVAVSGATLNASTTGSAANETLTTTVEDADGNVITGTANYNNAVTLTDNDTSGATSLSLNGCSTAGTASVTLTSPAAVVTLCYSGLAINPFTVTASGTGVTQTGAGTISTHANDVAFTGTTLCSTAVGCAAGDADYGYQTLFFATPSGTQTVSATEAGYTDAPYSKTFAGITLDSASCTGVATVTAGPANSYTVTATGVGICKAKFNDGLNAGVHNATAGADGTFYISVTSASLGVNGHRK